MTESAGLGLTDEWLGIDVDLAFSRPTAIWTYPIETVSQSEGGFELVHQSVAVQPHWHRARRRRRPLERDAFNWRSTRRWPKAGKWKARRSRCMAENRQ